MRKGQFPARLVAVVEIGVQGRAKDGYRPGLPHDAVQAGYQRFSFFIHVQYRANLGDSPIGCTCLP